MKPFFADTEQLFSLENRFKIPLAFLLACTFFVFLTGDPEDVMYYWNAFWFFGGLIMMVILFSLVAHIALPLAGKGIRMAIGSPKFNEAVAMLESGLYTGGDFLIRTESPKEAASVAADKLQAKIHEASGEWGVFFQFRNPEGLLFQGNKAPLAFDRQSGPPGFPEEGQAKETNYQTESWQEYETDLKGFFRYYPDWAKDYKWQQSDKSADGFITRARTIYTVAALLLLSFTMSAQTKSEQVRTFLGEKRASLKPVGPVVYRFAKMEINRDADGSKNMIEVLKDKPMYSDADNVGFLLGVSVTINGKLIALTPMPEVAPRAKEIQPAMPAGNSRKDMQGFVRPHKDTTTRAEVKQSESEGNPWPMDSIGMTDKLTATKEKLSGLVLPLWNGVLIGCDVFFYFLLWIAGLSRFASVVCNNETRINSWGRRIYGDWMAEIGQAATAINFTIAFLLSLIFLTNFYFSMVNGSVSGLLSTLFSAKAFFAYGWIAILSAAAWGFNKWVPNPKIINRETGVSKR